MKKKWSSVAWERSASVYEKIVAMPFNQELMKGTLAENRFKFYVAQDSMYLADFGKALATIGSKLSDADQALSFLKFSSETIQVERALHGGYFEQFGIRFEDYEKSPTCYNYTNFLLSTSAYQSVEVAVAATLPCFWIYKEVGDHIFENGVANNPYQSWIDTYSGEDFGNSVKRAIEITDELAENASEKTKQQMFEAYIMAAKLEWMFWDSAYQLEKWAI
ncbi:MAG: thiaminase II [Cyclobacteriaceae bacterium]|nr:thiaminase II [Cyclobacteriaceae bacterium]MCH8517597.1 thiaminase II [Cyclobacteriaceae bacterium]